MKKKLLDLINYKTEIGYEILKCKYANQSSKFKSWKENLIVELEELHKVNDEDAEYKIEDETLNLLKNQFNGHDDIIDFKYLSEKLEYIKNNIDKYYSDKNDKKSTSTNQKFITKQGGNIYVSY